MVWLDCGREIEGGRKDRAPVAARFCPKCRSGRGRRHNLKCNWLSQHEPIQLAVCRPNCCFGPTALQNLRRN